MTQASNILKIVFFGPQNTGKTTLCKKLAKAFNCDFVPEYARLYAENHKKLSFETVLPIANGQLELEQKYLQKTKSILFFDTNILETLVYSDIYYNKTPVELEQMVKTQIYTLYFLPYIDVSWENDNIRDLSKNRLEHYNRFKQELTNRELPFIELKGDLENRFLIAKNEINRLLQQREI
ncbi:AAA family ATPase [Aurantibacter sp.]|uniref:AAA family ATPase n=1 Tax=Aurantibacter sp. TaxID=2807103 RepID=UPI0035C847CD